MNEQIECSLPVAIKFCREKNGWARRKDGHTWHEKSYFDAEFTMFTTESVTETWIYEPPQSAFEVWNKDMPKDYLHNNYSYIIRGRKEGWNGALIEIEKPFGDRDFIVLFRKDLEKLKEV